MAREEYSATKMRELSTLVTVQLEVYCNLIRNGVYSGYEFDGCRTELKRTIVALRKATKENLLRIRQYGLPIKKAHNMVRPDTDELLWN